MIAENLPQPDRRLIVSVDMQRYSHRDNLAQYRAQQTFTEAIAEAVRAVGLDRAEWLTQQGGDSELAILPVGTYEPTVVGNLPSQLNDLLRRANRDVVAQARVRVRMAVHEGLVHVDGANGYPGDAVNMVCRLRDARSLKRALSALPDANLGLIVSESIYRDVVSQQYEGIRSTRFRKIVVDDAEKQFHSDAWICVVDEDVTALDLGVSAANRPSPDSSAPMTPAPAAGTYSIGNLQNSGSMAVGNNASAFGIIRPEEMP